MRLSPAVVFTMVVATPVPLCAGGGAFDAARLSAFLFEAAVSVVLSDEFTVVVAAPVDFAAL